MDTPQTITHVSLCAGYGGIDLGLKRAIPNLRTIAFSEIEAFACANLVSKMEAGHLDAAPIWTDLKTFPWAEFHGKVDILSGGYPCQPFSAAGKRLGIEDPRHLWPFIADGIRLMQPRVCFFENVEGHISLGLRAVIEELGNLGYQTTWGIFSAAEVGAPHQRKRIFILAHRDGERGQLSDRWRFASKQLLVGHGPQGRDDLADSGSKGSQGQRGECKHGEGGCEVQAGWSGRNPWPSNPGQSQYGWEPRRTVAYGNRGGREIVGQSELSEQQGAPRNELDGRDCAEFAVGDTEGQRSSTQRAKHEGLGGQLCAAGASGESIVGNAASWQDNRRKPRDMEGETAERGCGNYAVDGAGKSVGDAASARGRESGDSACAGQRHRAARPGGGNDSLGQAQPSLGGDADGSACGMDYAELCVASDNRTDELRLLGNGVVPATATRAFLTLVKELNESSSLPTSSS